MRYVIALFLCLSCVHCRPDDLVSRGRPEALGDGGGVAGMSAVAVDRSGRTHQSPREPGTTTPRDAEAPSTKAPPADETPVEEPEPGTNEAEPDTPPPTGTEPPVEPEPGTPMGTEALGTQPPAEPEGPETPAAPPNEPTGAPPGTTTEVPAQPEPGPTTVPPGTQPPTVPAEPPVELPAGFLTAESNTAAYGQPGYTIVHEVTGMEFVWVPPGEFEMGAYGGNPDATPAHKVAISQGMWLGKCEVTNAQFQLFCKAARHPFPAGSDAGPQHPVVLVSWPEAVQFCEHYGMRLPTEAEWEYAARGAGGCLLPWGDRWDPDAACAADNRGPDGRTCPVGSFPEGASWCGALDMAGNVFEWCSDWYYHRAYTSGDNTDPRGPATGTYRVVRGGGFSSPAPLCRSAIRSKYPPNYAMRHLGFRCVLSQPAPAAAGRGTGRSSRIGP